MVHLVLQWFSREDFASGRVRLANGHFRDSVSRFPELETPGSLELGAGLGIVVGKGTEEELVMLLENVEITHEEGALLCTFTPGEKLPFTSKRAKKDLYKRVSGPAGVSPWYPPCCCVVDEVTFHALRMIPLKDRLAALQTKNDWHQVIEECSAVLGPLDTWETRFPLAWQDADLVSTMGFAMGKLAETTLSSVSIPDEKAYLSEQRRHRRLTLKWRTRHCELEPSNPSAWSNLAYFHYQNITELSGPRARKDGDLWMEIQEFLHAVDESLRLDPTRIKDRYRRGKVLGAVLPDHTVFGDRHKAGRIAEVLGWEKYEEAPPFELADWFRTLAIAEFLKVEALYGDLDPADPDSRRCRREYLKSVYQRGKIHAEKAELVVADEEMETYLAEIWGEEEGRNGVQDASAQVELALACFVRVWKEDRPESLSNGQKLEKTPVEGAIPGVYRLYQIGKTRHLKYQISLRASSPKDPVLLSRAEGALRQALDLSWPSNDRNQSKDFIAERLARVYLAQDRPQEAVSILLAQGGKKRAPRNGSLVDKVRAMAMQEYVVRTLVLALRRSNHPGEEIQRILALPLERKGWKDRWKTLLVQAMVLLYEERWDRAERCLAEALEAAETIGKKNTASLLALAAHALYQRGALPAACDLLEKAHSLQPWRTQWKRRLALLLSALEQSGDVSVDSAPCSRIPLDSSDF